MMNDTIAFTPVFSCMAVSEELQPVYQHRWFLVDENGHPLSDDSASKVAELDLSIRFGYLVFRAPGMLRLDIPMAVLEDDETAFEPMMMGGQTKRVVNEGELATAWFSNYFGKTVHLMKVHPDDHSLLK